MAYMSKSTAAKTARSGKDMGKPGKNFSKIAASAGKRYGSQEAGNRVAGAIFQKMRSSGKLHQGGKILRTSTNKTKHRGR